MEGYVLALMTAATGVAALLFFLAKTAITKVTNILLQDPNVNYKIALVDKEVISHDTRIFKFALHGKDQILGLPIGQHIYLSTEINGDKVVRPYTPVSPSDEKGYFDLVIKVYKAGVHPKFPEGGKLTQYLDNMNIGDLVNVRGPSGNCMYKGKGTFDIRKMKGSPFVSKHVTKVGMIAGGSGITPMLQIIRESLRNPLDNIKMWLVYANQTPDDILLRDEIDTLAEKHPDRFQRWYTVDKLSSDNDYWEFDKGFISAPMLEAHCPAAGSDVLMLACGPPPMMKFAVDPALEKLGYDKDQIYHY